MKKIKYIYDEFIALLCLIGVTIGVAVVAFCGMLFIIMLTPWFWFAVVVIVILVLK